MGVHIHALGHGRWVGQFSPLYHMGSKDKTQVISRGDKHVYSTNYVSF